VVRDNNPDHQLADADSFTHHVSRTTHHVSLVTGHNNDVGSQHHESQSGDSSQLIAVQFEKWITLASGDDL
jgi:hypothetical protein